jgi:hypothetical protein
MTSFSAASPSSGHAGKPIIKIKPTLLIKDG